MFEEIARSLEARTASQVEWNEKTHLDFRKQWIVRHVISVTSISFSFLLLMLGQILEKKGWKIANISIIAAGLCLLCGQYLIISFHPFIWLARKAEAFKIFIRSLLATDFLALHFITACIFIVFPLIAAILLFALSPTTWITFEAKEFDSFRDSLHRMTTLVVTLIGIQITLFNFVIGQLLGKYSSAIASTVSTHPAIRIVRSYALLVLGLLLLSDYLGCPASFYENTLLQLLLLFPLAVCIPLTLWIATSGINVENAITYKGIAAARELKRLLKPAFPKSPNLIWKCLYQFGFDFREVSRIYGFSPSDKSIDCAIKSTTSLINVANQAVQDNQHEAVRASITSIVRIADQYAIQRANYLTTEDRFFSFLNNQFSMLLKASEESPNEQLIFEIVKAIGDLARINLRFGGLIGDTNVEERAEYSKNHYASSLWMGLLQEGFERAHKLTRTTAASEAIRQMSFLAQEAFEKGYDQAVSNTYFYTIRYVHKTCITINDPYHALLAAECLQSLMTVWYCCLNSKVPFHLKWSLQSRVIEVLDEMGNLHIRQIGFPTFGFSDFVNVTTTRLSNQKCVFQDIFLYFLRQEIVERREVEVCAHTLAEMLRLISRLTETAVDQNIVNADNLIETLFDVGYFLFRGDIKNAGIATPILSQKVSMEGQEVSLRERLICVLNECWQKLLPIFYKKRHLCYGWEHSMFSILGMAMASLQEHDSPCVKKSLEETVRLFLAYLQQEKIEGRVNDNDWGYLQLLGAWTSHFLKDEKLSATIAAEVAPNRSFDALSGIYGEMEVYGYPLVEKVDFHLLNMQIRPIAYYLSQSDWDLFEKWHSRAMEKSMLLAFYERVENIRKLIEK